ncbi:hypothetical protein GALMADRAFT_148324 [Galerina marginata CBS 339.88]|uniref:DUF6534 domain-containing protein n=1 Tax=Galerina marginata (strain CBS 339.88) TaxID=685588 RepID=A0A067S4Q8_GALM3|nr:hypothetical protein GALMADRAFT_148324 [Galerina marginata CBS 339.88]
MAPTPLLSLADQTLDNTVGAMLLGVVGASLLFGITTLQTYCYYHTYPNDSHLHKCSVAILWILDALHLILVVHAIYTYAVTGFGNIFGLLEITWSLKLQASVNVLIIVIVHSLYAMRVWLLGGYHRGVLGYIVASVVIAGFAIGVFLSYSIYTVKTYPELERVAWVIDAALGTSTTIDFIIAAAMCYYLRKSKGGITRLNSRISTIMQYSLSSGLLTSACSLSAMFSYILLPNTFVFLAIEFLLTKLYVSSFIAMLNARERKTLEGTSYDEYGTDPSWKRQLNLHTTSSFWSPRPPSMDTLELPSPPGIAQPHLPGHAW